jgi:uncharacterized protein related to proFAR isomerase
MICCGGSSSSKGESVVSDFNIQQALTDMETRIRLDIAHVGAAAYRDAEAASTVAEEAKVEAVKLGGRVASLEEKAGWIAGGFGATLLSVIGFIWHVLTAGTPKH